VELDKQHKIAKGDLDVFTNAVNKWESAAVSARDAAKKLNDEHAEAIGINKRLTAAQKEQSRQAKLLYERDHAEALKMVREMTADKVLKEISGYGGVVLKTSLDETKEQVLRDALQKTVTTE